MIRGVIAGGALATMLVLIALAEERDTARHADVASATPAVPTPSTASSDEGLLYGRVTTDDGAVYQGRLRWGGDEEALWSHYFNGFKKENAWAARVPTEELPTERAVIGLFGMEIFEWDRPRTLRRPFMVRFGEIARIESRGWGLRVTLKSGTAVDLDRFGADDVADGLRVWDEREGIVELDEWDIDLIELLPTPAIGDAPEPLHGTVRTSEGDFTGLVQWDREQSLRSDRLDGRGAGGEVSLSFESIRSIARRSHDSALVALLDGREMVLSGTREIGEGNRGIYVDDARYGRVLVSWDAFERVDFGPAGAAPAYGDFTPGHPLMGSVTTRSGRRIAGRLVYDLDESETTETLDAPSRGVNYTIPFARIASIVPAGIDESGATRVTLTLLSGEVLRLEPDGDVGDGHGGMLVFSGGVERPEYVSWSEVERVDFDRPPSP